jgi:hypothetical protein
MRVGVIFVGTVGLVSVSEKHRMSVVVHFEDLTPHLFGSQRI